MIRECAPVNEDTGTITKIEGVFSLYTTMYTGMATLHPSPSGFFFMDGTIHNNYNETQQNKRNIRSISNAAR